MTQMPVTAANRAELHVQKLYRQKLSNIIRDFGDLAQQYKVDLSSVKYVIFQPEGDHMAVYFDPYPVDVAHNFLFNQEVCLHIAEQAKTELHVVTRNDGYAYWLMR